MGYINYSMKQSEKKSSGIYLWLILVTFLVALLFMVSIHYNLSEVYEQEFIDQVNQDYGCHFNHYELSCNESYYELGSLTIDLNANPEDYQGKTVLMKDGILLNTGQILSYETLLQSSDFGDGTISIAEVMDHFRPLRMGIELIIGMFAWIGIFIYFLLANHILAFFMKLFVNEVFQISYQYNQMYILATFIAFPYILFNAFTRLAFKSTLAGYLSHFIPWVNGLVHITLDYLILFGILYLFIKKYQNKVVDEISFGDAPKL